MKDIASMMIAVPYPGAYRRELPLKAVIRAVVTVALVVGSAGLATAAPPLGCFVRTYDAAHLRNHPDQQVTRLWVRIGPFGDRIFFGMNIWLRGKRQIWRAGGPCVPSGDGWTCQPDSDGASPLIITRKGATLRLDNPGSLKIEDDVTGPDLNDAMLAGPGDASFALRSAADRFCKDPHE
jgi:hypothetical protein